MGKEEEMILSDNRAMAFFLIATLVLILTVRSASAQSQNVNQPSSDLAAPLALLPGYKMQISAGIDSSAGKIWKDGGPTIDVEFCCGFGDMAESIDKRQVLWREDQMIDGQPVACVYTKSRELIVSYPRRAANFRAKIRNEKDLSEMLLMVLTYDPYKAHSVEPGAIVASPKGHSDR